MIDTFVRTFVRSKVFLYRHMSHIYSVCMDTYLRITSVTELFFLGPGAGMVILDVMYPYKS